MKYKRIFPKYKGKGNNVPNQEPTNDDKAVKSKKKHKGSRLSDLMSYTIWRTP
jgi:hypothetical protein